MTPRIFLALHVYTPPSCDVTSQIISPPRDCTTRLFKGLILEFCFSHVTRGVRFPLTSHCNEARPVSCTSMDTRRWHNRRSWDGFTRIALGSLRTLISLSSFVSFRSLGSTRSGRTMLAWGTRPSSSSPYSSLAVYLTGQATHGQLDFSFDVVTADYYTRVWFLVFIFWAAFVATVCFCN